VSISREADLRAARTLLEVVDMNAGIGSKAVGQSVLEASCGLAVLREQWLPAARWYGAAEAQSAQTGLHRDPADEAFVAPRVAKARAALGAPGFAAADGEGRALGYDEAIAEARAWLASLTVAGS
jgi:hypothetical protein